MSALLSLLPLTEIAAALTGTAVAGYSLYDLVSSKKRSTLLASLLRRDAEWLAFEENALKEILRDRHISEDEWTVIIEKVDHIVSADSAKKRNDLRAIYPNRSEKAKRLLLADMLAHQAERA